MSQRVIILDLDNTLYSWIDTYAPSFRAQVNYLVAELGIEYDTILYGFKVLFKKYGSVEIPNSVTELDIWKQVNLNNQRISDIQRQAQNKFYETWEANTNLYTGVEETLKWAHRENIMIFGLTDAFSYWVKYRLDCLGILDYFKTIYARSNAAIEHLLTAEQCISCNRIIPLDINYLKPSTHAIDQIVNNNNLYRNNIYLVGDNLYNDIATAQNAKIQDIWAQYGTQYRKESGRILKSITPWAPNQRGKDSTLTPSYIINNFSELIDILKAE